MSGAAGASAPLSLEVRSGLRIGERLSPTLPCEIGRAAEAGLRLPDSHLSGAHGRLYVRQGALCYADRGSSNGSIHVRGRDRTPLDHRCAEVELWDGDELDY